MQDPARAAASGRPQQQTDDVKQQILAALNDSECNQHIYLLGGSSGGYHALFGTLDSSHENVTDWDDDDRAKIKAVVGFSGIYALQSRDFGNVGPDFDADAYVGALRNYTNTTDSFVGLEYQLSVSPQTLIPGATNIPPIRLYASVDDTVPPNQSENMRQALQSAGADVAEYTIDGDAHCFNQWNVTNNNTGNCVGAEVIDFLEAHP